MSRSLLTAMVCALCALGSAALGSGGALAQGDNPSLVIDVGVEGNGGTLIGPIENCVEAESGDEFAIDIIIEDVSELLAWELALKYDPEVVIVVNQDVKQFQEADGLSSVIDISQQLPDASGFHTMSAFESSDPPQADSGGGVLARVTLEAVGSGESALEFGEQDDDQDGELDRGTLLRNLATEIIGDDDDDTFFDGDAEGAQVVVDGVCPPDTIVAQAEAISNDDGDDSSFPVAIVGGAVAAGAVIVLGGAGVLLRNRRRPSAPGAPTEI